MLFIRRSKYGWKGKTILLIGKIKVVFLFDNLRFAQMIFRKIQ